MKRSLFILFVVMIASCTNLPKAGWYKNITSGERIYVVLTGSEEQITAHYKNRFVKDDFISAFARTRSSQFLNEGKPKYYAVVGAGEDTTAPLSIVAIEVLERDYQRVK